ncbi:MAG TPA: hypothetical protein VF297_01645 [Pyrinomonadaceae bacterium]
MRYALCLLAITLLLPITAHAQSRRVAGAHLKRGDLLMSRNKVVEALVSYDKAIVATSS